ncbi:MAG: PAS domain-containing protein [Fibrobacter sp.]|nr:PAS domain-containing protein [Fibrobacter sp.]
MKTKESAYCEINDHGRLLNANKRFCRLFGYKEEQVEWHYIRDVFRYDQDWTTFIQNATAKAAHFIVRLKNRKGRSFLASISRKASELNGKTIYQNTFQKLSDIAENDNEISLMVEEPLYEAPQTIAL